MSFRFAILPNCGHDFYAHDRSPRLGLPCRTKPRLTSPHRTQPCHALPRLGLPCRTLPHQTSPNRTGPYLAAPDQTRPRHTAPNLLHLCLFLLGAIAMRGAGATYNDIVDRDLDAKVERTRGRPVASGRVSIGAAKLLT